MKPLGNDCSRIRDLLLPTSVCVSRRMWRSRCWKSPPPRLSYLVLPRNPEELSAEDLDAVAGGLGASVQCTCNLVKPM